MRPDLSELVSILDAWVGPHGFTIHLFGSRVRGDHRPDSDVDVVVEFPSRVTSADANWWGAQNEDDFATINARLPGRLQILEPDDALAKVIRNGGQHAFRAAPRVVVVTMPPKP